MLEGRRGVANGTSHGVVGSGDMPSQKILKFNRSKMAFLTILDWC